MNRLEEIKEHFDYCMENGLTFGEQEEKLLHEIYGRVEELEAVKEAHIEELGYVDEQLLEAQEDNQRYKQALETIAQETGTPYADIAIKALAGDTE